MAILTISLVMIVVKAAVPLLYATLGELLTEKSGVVNLGVEGVMAMGAVVGFAVAYYTDSTWIGVAVALLMGALLGFIHSLWTVSFQADQVLTGIVMVITCDGLSSFLGQRLGPGGKSLVGLKGPRLEPLALPGILNQDLLAYICFLSIIFGWVFIYKTRPGLELRALGENPGAIDVSGIRVNRLRYTYTTIGAAMMAMGGAYLPLVFSPGWSVGMSGGRGWIAIGLVIVSRWNPLLVVVGAMLFGGVNAIQFRLQALGTTIPSALLRMLPYAAAIIVLIVATYLEKLQKAEPAALGLTYTRE